MKETSGNGTALGLGADTDLFAELCRADDARCAELVADLRRRWPELQADAAGQSALADLGELAAPVAHHVNNFLNTLLLDLAVIEGSLEEPHREGVEEIRRQGRVLAQVVRSWQQYRRGTPEPAWQTDFGIAARRAVRALAANPGRLGPIAARFPGDPPAAPTAVGVEVHAEPAPPVPVPPAELERVVRFLTANAVGVSSRGQTVVVRTGPTPGGAGSVLTVEDAGPTPTTAELINVFDPAVQVREETTPLELAACQAVVRRRGGTVKAETRPGGGLVVRVTFPPPGP